MKKTYICIDLKSFYASVECVERGLNPLKTNLVVADEERSEKTICLAVSPSLKKYGIGGRARLFEVNEKVKEINKIRKKQNNYKPFISKSFNDDELKKDKTKELSFIIAKPRMAHYIDASAKIYSIYLKYLSSEDLFVYSIDEVFADITNYLKYYKLSPKELTAQIINDVYKQTGITATAGIGTNLFLAKVAMDIIAKHTKEDKYGVRIAELDEMTYRKQIWNHKPITDIWRVGKGIASKLEKYGIYTMGDIAKCSIKNEDLLYKLFGINAELLIDHAWGWEPCTIKSIKSYTPDSKCITSGQVLACPYDYQKTKLVIREMADLLALELTSKNLVTGKLTLTIGYDIQNINNNYQGEITTDFYGRKIPKHAHGTITLSHKTSSSKTIMNALVNLYDKIINPKLLTKRINLTAVDVTNEKLEEGKARYYQLDLFSDAEKQNNLLEDLKKEETKERKLQGTLLNIKEKYGKNSILRLMDLEKDATTKKRNEQIGGHHA